MRWRVQDIMFPWTHTVSKLSMQCSREYKIGAWRWYHLGAKLEMLCKRCECVRANEKGRERGKSLGDKLTFCNSGEKVKKGRGEEGICIFSVLY